jgi:Flp pilus assembly protein TadG
MVEMALVFPLLVLLVLGIFEFGMAWKSSLSVSNALRSGARAAANTGEGRTADYDAITATVSAMTNVDGAEISKIVIYRSTALDGDVPPSCLTAAAAGNGGVDTGAAGVRCNVYEATDLASIDPSDFSGTTTCAAGSLDRQWCPVTERESSQGAVGGADYVGVYIEVEQAFQTGMFGDGITIKDETIMRLEPPAR